MLKFLNPLSLEKARTSFLSNNLVPTHERQWLKSIQTRVHKNERSYLENGGEHYLKVGLSALNCIQHAIKQSGLSDPVSILDFPSGYGRVLRFLKAGFPKARISGMEIKQDAVKFCRKAFDIQSSLSNKDFRQLQFDRCFDLIWCGSLITHLDEPSTGNLLSFFFRHLNPNGLCVFTCHGKEVEHLLETGQISYSLSSPKIESVITQYRRTGFGFTEYDSSRNGYGISLSSDEKIRELADQSGNWECTSFIPKGWDNHQDVYSYVRRT